MQIDSLANQFANVLDEIGEGGGQTTAPVPDPTAHAFMLLLAEDTLQFLKEDLGLRPIGDFTEVEARVFASRSVREH